MISLGDIYLGVKELGGVKTNALIVFSRLV